MSEGNGSAFAFGLWLLTDVTEIKIISWNVQNDPYKDPGYSYIWTQVSMRDLVKGGGGYIK